MSIWEFLGLAEDPSTAPASPETETVRRIVESLDRMDPDRARYVAGFAYILGRVAHADSNISPEETRVMEGILVEHGGLPEEQAIVAVQIAKSQNKLFGATENFVVTRNFGKNASREEKLRLLDCLFAVSAADLHISTIEDNEAARVAKELKLSHQDYVEVRRRYREHLGVLKKDATSPRT